MGSLTLRTWLRTGWKNSLHTEPWLLGSQTESTGRRRSCWWSAAADVADDGSLQRLTWTKNEPWWRFWSSHAGRFPKILFALSRCRISRMEVPETYSPDRRCMPSLGVVQTTKAAQQREGGKTLTFELIYFCWRVTGHLYRDAKPTFD